MAKIIRFHPHAQERISERGATESEIIETILRGETFPAKFGRYGFRRNFPCENEWRGRRYGTKQIEAYAEELEDGWLVITVIVKYF